MEPVWKPGPKWKLREDFWTEKKDPERFVIGKHWKGKKRNCSFGRVEKIMFQRERKRLFQISLG